MRITSTANPRVQASVRLRDRKGREASGRFLIEGRRELDSALNSGVQLLEAFVRDGWQERVGDATAHLLEASGAALIEVSERVADRLSYGGQTSPVVAVAKIPSAGLPDLGGPGPIVVLDGIEKPGNLGAVVRTAAGFGVCAVIVADAPADPYGPNAVRASQGAVFHVPVLAMSGAAARSALRDEGRPICVATPDGGVPPWELSLASTWAVVIGREDRGVSAGWVEAADYRVSIPLEPGVDSLNLSVAAAILLHECRRPDRE